MNEVVIRDFDRSLAANFVALLEKAAEQGWWRDVLEDRKLIVALRGKSLNVYWKGQSVFRVEAGVYRLKATTHEKFLLDPKLKGQVGFDGENFNVAALRTKGFLEHYQGSESLGRMKRAAEIYAKEEKKGCHQVAVGNPQVIDVEIALSGSVEGDEPGDEIISPRIDLLALEPQGDDKARLVFWEAKAFKNADLGSSRSKLQAPVLAQIAAYRAILEPYREELETSYTNVCRNLHSIRAAAGQRVHRLVEEVATGTRTITLGQKPQVNLLVFGFDDGQRRHPDWIAHRSSIEAALAKHGARLLAVGQPKGVRL